MATLALKDKTFELIENESGYALESTRMVFDSNEDPLRAVFTGPNTKIGQVLVSGDRMLYQSTDLSGNLTAGEAIVALESSDGMTTMVLNWRWLTGDRSNGVSKWREVDA